MITTVPAQRFLRFEEAFRAGLVMPLLIERHGALVARDMEQAILAAIDRPASRPDHVRWPEY